MEDQRFAKSAQTIPHRLESLKSDPIAELKQQWRAYYGSNPPLRIRTRGALSPASQPYLRGRDPAQECRLPGSA
jgi:hypothetical protein